MKAPLVIASLLANLTFVTALAVRPALAPAGIRDFLAQAFGSGGAPAAVAPTLATPAPLRRTPLWASVRHDDPRTFAARLRAAGFPAAIIRAILTAEIGARYEERVRALMDPDPDTPFWKLRPTFFMLGDKRLEEITAIQRERTRILRDLFSDEFFATDDVSLAQRRQFGNLSRSQIDALQRVEDDYTDMIGAVRAAMQGIVLPEDREKLALLAREKRADLAAILTPAELADYEIRTSPTTQHLRTRLGGFDPNESEFRAIFQTQQAFNEKFPGSFGSVSYEARQAAQRDYLDTLRAALGDARYADYVREVSSDFQQVSRLAQRENLPRETALQAFAVREEVARESTRIFDDMHLSVDDKRAALQSLAQSARTKILATLGPGAGPEYARIAETWLSNVERGSAVSFTHTVPMFVINDHGTVGYSGGPEYRRLTNSPPPGR